MLLSNKFRKDLGGQCLSPQTPCHWVEATTGGLTAQAQIIRIEWRFRHYDSAVRIAQDNHVQFGADFAEIWAHHSQR